MSVVLHNIVYDQQSHTSRDMESKYDGLLKTEVHLFKRMWWVNF